MARPRPALLGSSHAGILSYCHWHMARLTAHRAHSLLTALAAALALVQLHAGTEARASRRGPRSGKPRGGSSPDSHAVGVEPGDGGNPGVKVYTDSVTWVEVRHGFLSGAEADMMTRIGTELVADMESSQPSYRSSFFSEDQWRTEHPSLEKLSTRVLSMAGVPKHSSDTTKHGRWKYHVETPAGQPWLRNVHHDRANGYDDRILTVLIYLSDVQRGGHTLFPCLGPDGGPPRIPALCEAFVRAYASGNRSLACSGPECWDSAAFAAVQLACQAAADGKLPQMLAVKPTKGLAALFPSSATMNHTPGAGNRPLPSTWHAACPVLDGEKHAVQLFLEA